MSSLAGIVAISEAKTVCAGSEKFYKMCESNEVSPPVEAANQHLKNARTYQWPTTERKKYYGLK